MRIVEAEVGTYRLPPASPWEDATNRVQALEFVVVWLTTDDGTVGTGLTYSVDIGGTAIATLVEDYLAPLVIGEDPLAYEHIWATLHRQSRRLGLGVNTMAIAAIDIAVWDLIGKTHKTPLYRLIGGARDDIQAYRSEINLAEDDTVDALIARIESYLDAGYRTVKIKIGHDDVERDLDRVAAASRRLGPGRLLVDLNQKWSSAEASIRGPQLDRFALGWVEEPLRFDDLTGHLRLRQHLRTPVALGESLHSSSQLMDYLRADAVDFVQADVAFVGGITPWLRIAHTALLFGKVVAPHYLMELSLQLLCGVPHAYLLENVVGGSLTELGLLTDPIEVSNGRAAPSTRPGHGITFDRTALARHRVDHDAVRSQFRGGSK